MAQTPKNTKKKVKKVTTKPEIDRNPKIDLNKELDTFIAMCTQFSSATDKKLDSETTKLTKIDDSNDNTIARIMSQIYPQAVKVFKIDTFYEKMNINDLKSRLIKSSGVRTVLKTYLTSVISLTEKSTNNENLELYLKHCWQFACFFVIFNKLPDLLLKTVVHCWATVDAETVRVRAFLLAHRLARLGDQDFCKKTLKKFNTAYVQNTKFVNEHSLPFINFMMRSLCELFALDNVLAYQYTFVYIRQMAIRLRTAITGHDTKDLEIVRGWQFISSLRLWTLVVSSWCSTDSPGSKNMRLLVHPLVQIITSTIKLFNCIRYVPLRFHLVDMLNQLSRGSGLFVPSLGLVLEVFDLVDFNKRHGSEAVKMFDISIMTHFSDGQCKQKVFLECMTDTIEAGVVESLNIHAQSMAFPELAVPVSMKIRKFLKRCRVPNYYRRIKSLLSHIDENAAFIKQKRSAKPNLDNDIKDVNILQESTPFAIFYSKWKKERDNLRPVDIDDTSLTRAERIVVGQKRVVSDNDGLVPSASKKARLELKKEFHFSDSDSDFLINVKQ